MSITKHRIIPGRAFLAAMLPGLIVALPACTERGDAPAAAVTETATAEVVEELAVLPSATPSDPAGTSAVPIGLDLGALGEKRDPERLLRFYSTAVRAGEWKVANMAWSSDAQMTPDKLQARYGTAGVKMAIGKGDVEGAAGSLYYEAPVVINYADGRPSQRGTIVLRRVNDVPGASAEQLVWRIERSSIIPN